MLDWCLYLNGELKKIWQDGFLLKILIVDDHDMVRLDISCVVIVRAKVLVLDIVLMNLHISGIGRLGATEETKSILPKVKIITL